MPNLNRLVWMKCVNRSGGKATYPGCKKAYADCSAGESFDLHWPNYRGAENAAKLAENEQIALVQHDHITHIVELIGTAVRVRKNSDHSYSREARVLWYDNNYDYLFGDVMGFEHRFANGLVLSIPNRPKFQDSWGVNRLSAFQRHVGRAIAGKGAPSQWESFQRQTASSAKKVAEAFRIPEEIDASREHYEGNVDQILVNRYERDPAVRDKCIAHHGTKCCICEFDFAFTYGEFMRDYIHVHHLKSLAQVGKRHKVDPILDLRPVCPNCHAVIHHQLNPHYSIQEIKRCIKRTSQLRQCKTP